MNLGNIINSITTDIGYSDKEIRDFIIECISKFYDEGFTPKYLICNPVDLKRIKRIFRGYEDRSRGKNCYQTDFGTIEILPLKDKSHNLVTITDKDYT